MIGYYTGEVIDILVKISYCHLCKLWESRLSTAEYEEWLENHVNSEECSANHSGASGNMEVDAILTMFQRSNENEVQYRNYIGDGDSKTYGGIVHAKPYGENFVINKKRMCRPRA